MPDQTEEIKKPVHVVTEAVEAAAEKMEGVSVICIATMLNPEDPKEMWTTVWNNGNPEHMAAALEKVAETDPVMHAVVMQAAGFGKVICI